MRVQGQGNGARKGGSTARSRPARLHPPSRRGDRGRKGVKRRKGEGFKRKGRGRVSLPHPITVNTSCPVSTRIVCIVNDAVDDRAEMF